MLDATAGELLDTGAWALVIDTGGERAVMTGAAAVPLAYESPAELSPGGLMTLRPPTPIDEKLQATSYFDLFAPELQGSSADSFAVFEQKSRWRLWRSRWEGGAIVADVPADLPPISLAWRIGALPSVERIDRCEGLASCKAASTLSLYGRATVVP